MSGIRSTEKTARPLRRSRRSGLPTRPLPRRCLEQPLPLVDGPAILATLALCDLRAPDRARREVDDDRAVA